MVYSYKKLSLNNKQNRFFKITVHEDTELCILLN